MCGCEYVYCSLYSDMGETDRVRSIMTHLSNLISQYIARHPSAFVESFALKYQRNMYDSTSTNVDFSKADKSIFKVKWPQELTDAGNNVYSKSIFEWCT